MPRRAAAQRREILPDPVYNHRLVTQLTNKVMLERVKSAGLVLGLCEKGVRAALVSRTTRPTGR